jgi:hypothetical protein
VRRRRRRHHQMPGGECKPIFLDVAIIFAA